MIIDLFKMIRAGLSLPLFLFLSAYIFHYGVKDTGVKEDYFVAGLMLILLMWGV